MPLAEGLQLNHILKIDLSEGFTFLLSNNSHITTYIRKKIALLQILLKDQRFQNE